MPKKSRFPQQLGWEDFLTIMRDIISWLLSQVGKPDHQPTLEVGLEAKVDDYEAVLTDYNIKKDLTPEYRELKDNAMKALREALNRVRDTLPVFFPDPAILGEFGLAGGIKTDEDELYIQASGCMAHWALVSVLPEYAPLVPDFDVAQPAFDDFVAKRQQYTLAFQAMQAVQNDMEQLRIPIQEQERKIFDWYRSRYPDANDPWWTDTPWGTSGGGEEPEEPEVPLPEIPDKPEGVYANFMTEPVIAMLVGCGKYGEHTGFDVVRAVTPAGVTETATRPEELFATNIDVINEPLLDTDIDPGYRYWYWVRARNGDEVGEWSEVVWVEYL